MMNVDLINDEIERLEKSKCCWSNIEKLAMLYIVKEHMSDDTISDMNVRVSRIPKG